MLNRYKVLKNSIFIHHFNQMRREGNRFNRFLFLREKFN